MVRRKVVEMTRGRYLRLIGSATALYVAVVVTLGAASAQDIGPFKPVVGQEGKDVIWVPTHQALVDRMLDMARLTVDDYVIDLGSGDGRTVITAARRGAKALGIEFNADPGRPYFRGQQ